MHHAGTVNKQQPMILDLSQALAKDHAMSIGDSAAAANCLSLCLTLSSIVRGGAGTTPTPSPYYYSAKHTLSHAGPRIAC